jgi:hypothetical protein
LNIFVNSLKHAFLVMMPCLQQHIYLPLLCSCMRQAELGVGDCGGLRYIPGAYRRQPGCIANTHQIADFPHTSALSFSSSALAWSISSFAEGTAQVRLSGVSVPAACPAGAGMTKSGVQKRPEWMDKMFGTEEKQ